MGEEQQQTAAPKLAKRRENRKSTFRLGRTIGEKREKLETANERQEARKKDKKKKAIRVIITVVGFCLLAAILVLLFKNLISHDEPIIPEEDYGIDYDPTIEIIDAAASNSANNKITSRMKRYIGRAEKDFRDLAYKPLKAVIPQNSIREVDFYLEGYSGYIKLTIDRDSAISVEDADRMLRYLKEKGIESFEYIDVRIDKKAYWK